MTTSGESCWCPRNPAARRRLAVCVVLVGAALSTAARAADSCPGGRDLVLTNGTILTVDAADRTVSTVRIRDKRILTVGESVNRKEPCVQIVDLGGRTVIPGLIDNHTHFVRTAQAPGPFVEGLESAEFHQGASGRAGHRSQESRARRMGDGHRRVHADSVRGAQIADAPGVERCGARPSRVHASRVLDARHRQRRRPARARSRRHSHFRSR